MTLKNVSFVFSSFFQMFQFHSKKLKLIRKNVLIRKVLN